MYLKGVKMATFIIIMLILAFFVFLAAMFDKAHQEQIKYELYGEKKVVTEEERLSNIEMLLRILCFMHFMK